MIRDRLSWMRFFGFDLGGAMPDEDTIRHYRNRLTESSTLEALMQAFEQQLREAGYLAMGGQIVDATLVPPAEPGPSKGRRCTLDGQDRGQDPSEPSLQQVVEGP